MSIEILDLRPGFMRKFLLFFLFVALFPAATFSQTLSSEAEISIITCGPFQGELYSAFGHNAFRVNDPSNGIDLAYNYGMFNFNQPNFYLNFARGYLYYQLGVYEYSRFEYPYVYYNRYVHEQILNLTQEQKQKMFDFLQWNALPENESYRYDYFYNNCATKMRDVVIKVLGDSVKFDGSYIKTDYTIRDLTDIYLEKQPWGDLGIDIGLGLPIDKVATPFEYMFLPDYVEAGFDHASIQSNGEVVPIVKKKNIINESRAEEEEKGLPHPLLIFGILALAAIVLTALDIKRNKLSTWFDAMLFSVTGGVGLLLLFLWFLTDHQASAYNLNVLWALPTHLIAVIAFIKNPRWLNMYFLITAVLMVILLMSWMILPQELNFALIPLVFALGVRAFTQYYIRIQMGA
jgi:hypothetical protein